MIDAWQNHPFSVHRQVNGSTWHALGPVGPRCTAADCQYSFALTHTLLPSAPVPACTCSQVNEQDIANIVAQWTGIPIEKVSSDETERLIKMEEVLHGRVIGQEEAVSAISRAIRRARVGLKNPNRWAGSC